MLSRFDIEKELGEGICIYPFKENNLKENSINLCASRLAWTLSSRKVKASDICKDTLNEDNGEGYIEFHAGGKAIVTNSDNVAFIVLLPHSTTLVETEEVLAVSGEIGGTYHSKVGLAGKGISHIGTMLGPNFSGHSLLALHNPTDKIIVIEEHESFVSVVFYYLRTSIQNEKNPTVGGHIEKFLEFGIKFDKQDKAISELNADWKSRRIDNGRGMSVQQKLLDSDEFKRWKARERTVQKRAKLLMANYKWSIIPSIITIIILAILFYYVEDMPLLNASKSAVYTLLVTFIVSTTGYLVKILRKF